MLEKGQPVSFFVESLKYLVFWPGVVFLFSLKCNGITREEPVSCLRNLGLFTFDLLWQNGTLLFPISIS